VLHSTFELSQEPMRFIHVLCNTFELLQEPMRFIIMCYLNICKNQ